MRETIDGPAFLLRGARLLAASLELPAIAARAARLAVPSLSDCCLVELADHRGGLVRAAEAHPASVHGVGHPSRAGASRLVVPLTGRVRCVGAMTFSSGDARVHAPEQRLLARQLARLVAQAVDDAQVRVTAPREHDEQRRGGGGAGGRPPRTPDLTCHACSAGAELCDVDRIRGLGWCRSCLSGSQVPAAETELGVVD